MKRLTCDRVVYILLAMANYRTIWKHEIQQADLVARILLADKKVALNWKVMVLPVFLYQRFKYSRKLRFTCKTILYTKQLAFEAAKNIDRGKDYAWEFRQIEIKTKDVLNKHKKGFYTEKIRRRQLPEIELLINHYRDLFKSNQSTYAGILREQFPAKGQYLSFLSSLHKREQDVIQAAITTMRKGTKTDRRRWFQKVMETTKKIRLAEADHIYA